MRMLKSWSERSGLGSEKRRLRAALRRREQASMRSMWRVEDGWWGRPCRWAQRKKRRDLEGELMRERVWRRAVLEREGRRGAREDWRGVDQGWLFNMLEMVRAVLAMILVLGLPFDGSFICTPSLSASSPSPLLLLGLVLGLIFTGSGNRISGFSASSPPILVVVLVFNGFCILGARLIDFPPTLELDLVLDFVSNGYCILDFDFSASAVFSLPSTSSSTGFLRWMGGTDVEK